MPSATSLRLAPGPPWHVAQIYAGVFNVAATEPHWALTTWVLEKARVRSIRAHVLEVGRLGVHAVGHLAALGARSAVARGAMLRKVSGFQRRGH
jgi:hypothetical protein